MLLVKRLNNAYLNFMNEYFNKFVFKKCLTTLFYRKMVHFKVVLMMLLLMHYLIAFLKTSNKNSIFRGFVFN